MCSIIWLFHAYDVVVYVNISTLHGTPLSQFSSRVYFYDVNLIYQHSISINKAAICGTLVRRSVVPALIDR
jgi:hypothetical protein